MKLWHGVNLSDEEFDEVFDSVEQEWKLYKYDRLEIFLHVFGLLLRFSKSGICKKNQEIILEEAKKHVDTLIYKKLIVPATIDEITYPDSYEYNKEAYVGLCYSSRNTEEFKELLEYIKVKKIALLYASFPAQAQELLELMKVDSLLFVNRLILNNHKDNKYYETPMGARQLCQNK